MPAAGALAYANTPPIDPAYNNRIIDDLVFANSGSMSAQDIQNFLNSKVPVCDTNHQGGLAQYPPPYTCLKDYVDPTTGKRAAQLIYDEAVSRGLNPQVILATLEKEQGLVTDTWPYPSQYKSAMGYGCPESQSVCDSQYYGFYNQVHLGATLLRVGMDRDCGNTSSFPGWSVSSQWRLGNSPGVDGVATRLDSCATGSLYNYTPHRPDSAYTLRNGVYYYGNYNFVNFFTSWFGSTRIPAAIKGSNDPTLYLYANGYKFTVPQLAVLQDYGFSPQSITTLPQSTVDSIPVPDQSSGLSSSIGSIVKSSSDSDEDGGSIYLISVGKRYQITSMSQFASFGFSEANIKYLPLTYILNSIPNGGSLSNFIYSPTGSTFQIASGQKSLIFDYQKYRSLNPSDITTPLSYYLTDSIASTTPQSSRDVLLRTTAGAIYVFNNSTYSLVGSMDAYNCWGFRGTQGTPLYQLYNDSYVSPISSVQTIGCTASDGSGNSYLLNSVNKLIIPPSYGFSAGPAINSTLQALLDRLPVVSAPLKQAVKANNSSGVWFLEAGQRKLIPTYRNFQLLGLNDSSLHILDPSALTALPAAGIKLGEGALVKPDSSAGVFVVHNNHRSAYSYNEFIAFGNNWNDIEQYNTSTLDAFYPADGNTISNYLYDSGLGKVLLVDPNGCYSLDPPLDIDFAKPSSSVSSSQPYTSSIFVSLDRSKCSSASNFVKRRGESLVYYVKNGVKRPFNTYSSWVGFTGGGNVKVLTVETQVLDSLPSGSPM